MSHVYEDLENIMGERGLMPYMLPNVMRSVEPWLRKHVPEERFWDGEYDTTHCGEYMLPEPTAEERETMFECYKMSRQLGGKKFLTVLAGCA